MKYNEQKANAEMWIDSFNEQLIAQYNYEASKKPCIYCGSDYKEDEFHINRCSQCGAPR